MLIASGFFRKRVRPRETECSWMRGERHVDCRHGARAGVTKLPIPEPIDTPTPTGSLSSGGCGLGARGRQARPL